MKKLLSALWAALVPMTACAHGALAIGLPESIGKDGFATGISWGYASVSEASERAIERCRGENVPANEHCRLLKTFAGECVAVAMDPERGTPGVGWAFARTKEGAGAAAMKMCQDKAGESRRAHCAVTRAVCDP